MAAADGTVGWAVVYPRPRAGSLSAVRIHGASGLGKTTLLRAFREQLATKGIESSEPFETPVCWISTLTDPDGNKVFLHQSKSA